MSNTPEKRLGRISEDLLKRSVTCTDEVVEHEATVRCNGQIGRHLHKLHLGKRLDEEAIHTIKRSVLLFRGCNIKLRLIYHKN